MLKESFFFVRSLEQPDSNTLPDPGQRTYRILAELVPNHPIYNGHFPGNPIVPGVCQIRMITEIVADIIQKEVILQTADNIKFLSAINPHETPRLTFDISLKPGEHDLLHCNAILSSGDKIFCKCKSVFQTRIRHHANTEDFQV
ncbi:MAG: 3-hydroxylacyl-ACP dehydratase [bacterium]